MKHYLSLYDCTVQVPFPVWVPEDDAAAMCRAEQILIYEEGIAFRMRYPALSIDRRLLAVRNDPLLIFTDLTDHVSCCIQLPDWGKGMYEIGESFQTDEAESYLILQVAGFLLRMLA